MSNHLFKKQVEGWTDEQLIAQGKYMRQAIKEGWKEFGKNKWGSTGEEFDAIITLEKAEIYIKILEQEWKRRH